MTLVPKVDPKNPRSVEDRQNIRIPRYLDITITQPSYASRIREIDPSMRPVIVPVTAATDRKRIREEEEKFRTQTTMSTSKASSYAGPERVESPPRIPTDRTRPSSRAPKGTDRPKSPPQRWKPSVPPSRAAAVPAASSSSGPARHEDYRESGPARHEDYRESADWSSWWGSRSWSDTEWREWAGKSEERVYHPAKGWVL